MSAISTGSQRASSGGDDGRGATRVGATARVHAGTTIVDGRVGIAASAAPETVLRARWRVGAHGSLEAVVHRVPSIPDSATSSATATMPNGSDGVRLTITLETSPRGARADRSLERGKLEGRKLEVRPLEGTMTTDRGLHGVVEHRLRFPSATASSGTAATGPISIDFVVGLGPSAVLLTDLPLAIGLRGGTYVLASADAPRAE